MRAAFEELAHSIEEFGRELAYCFRLDQIAEALNRAVIWLARKARR